MQRHGPQGLADPDDIFKKWCASYISNFTAAIDAFIKETSLKSNLLSAFDVTSLRDALFNQLKHEFLSYLREECKTINFTPTAGQSLAAQSHEFLNFLDTKAGSEGSANYSDILCKKNPLLKQKLGIITANFINNTQNILARTLQNYSVLTSGFFEEIKETNLFLPEPQFDKAKSSSNVVLKRIKFANSDPHKLGEQVAILEFVHVDNPQQIYGRIVYKPTSVMADAQITGDIHGLKQVLAANKEQTAEYTSSFVELVNAKLAEDLKLPTYMICPRKDPKTGEDYGFIQFLSHTPSADLDVQEHISHAMATDIKTVSVLQQLPYRMQDTWQRKLEENYNRQKEFTSDSVFKSKADMDRYSMQCGLLLFVAYILRIIDLHNENLIVHKRMPYLIDLECSFQQHISIAFTHLLDRACGALSDVSIAMQDHKVLAGNTILDLIVDLPQQNRAYIAQVNKLVPFRPDKDKLLAGFLLAEAILRQNSAEFLAWLNSPAIQSLVVRYLVFDTESLASARKHMEGAPTVTEWQQNLVKYYQSQKSKWLSDLKIDLEYPEDSMGLTPPYCEALNDQYVRDQLMSNSLPIFYIAAAGLRVVDAKHNVVRFDWEKISHGANLADSNYIKVAKEQLGTDRFVHATGLDLVRNSISDVARNTEQHAAEMAKCVDEITQVLEKPEQSYTSISVSFPEPYPGPRRPL